MTTRREFVVFTVESDLAHFRRQYSITTALTYPIPPRTALCGLVGAILGLPKDGGLSEFGEERAIFGLQVVEPVRLDYLSLNLVNTKQNATFQLKRPNPRTTVRYEVIIRPCYRIFFSHETLSRRLADAVGHGETWYTPCLGLAWMIAWVGQDVRLYEGELVRDDTDVREYGSLVRSEDVRGEIEWDSMGVYQRIRMPAVMTPDRRVQRYESYIIETTGRSIRASLGQYWKLIDGTRFCAM